MHNPTKTFRRITASLAICTLFSASAGHAQLAQTWNVQAREQAERATSAGISMLQKKQTASAISAFEKGSASDPTDPNPFAMLGLALTMDGKYDQALHALQKAYALRPSSETLLSTGIVYYLQHDYDAAINSWTQALQVNSKLWPFYGNIGFAHLRKGELTKAEENFSKLVKHQPNSSLGYQGIATAKYLKGDFAGARTAAERSVAIYNYAPVVLLLAKLDALQGDRTKALQRAQQANSMTRKKNAAERSMTEMGYPLQHDVHWDPFAVGIYDNGYLLAARLQDPLQAKQQMSLARQGRAVQAIEASKAQLASDPSDLFLLRELGLAQMANGEYPASADTFKKVIEIAPHFVVDALHAARSLSMAGKGDEGSGYVSVYRNKWPNQKLSPALVNIGCEPAAPVTPVKETPAKAQKPEKQPKKVKVQEPREAKPRARSSDKSGEEKNTIPASEF